MNGFFGVAMGGGSEERFEAYVETLARALGHADRAVPFRYYATGLLLPLERKSVEPMAARADPTRVGAAHQSLHHFVAKAAWSDDALLAAVRREVLPSLEAQGGIEAWIVDDTGFPKKGQHSVGVARQYCGQLGKQDNCQVAVSLSVASEAASLPIAWRLYLPEAWANDPVRRAKAGVPEGVTFQTKPALALQQIEAALAADVPRGVVLADAGYGADMKFQAGLLALGLDYVVGVPAHATVWPEGMAPLPPKPWSGRGRPPHNLRRAPGHGPVQVRQWAQKLAPTAWQQVTWREGGNGALTSRFAATRVRPAHRDDQRREPWPKLRLLVEWPEGEPEPTNFWFANLARDLALDELVRLAKLRWRMERDYLDLKQELGLGHYEGRGWRGFHHHASLCIAAYGFLVRERLAFSPSGTDGTPSLRRRLPALPEGFVPRGRARETRAARPCLHHLPPPRPHPTPRPSPTQMPLLHAPAAAHPNFMTQ